MLLFCPETVVWLLGKKEVQPQGLLGKIHSAQFSPSPLNHPKFSWDQTNLRSFGVENHILSEHAAAAQVLLETMLRKQSLNTCTLCPNACETYPSTTATAPPNPGTLAITLCRHLHWGKWSLGLTLKTCSHYFKARDSIKCKEPLHKSNEKMAQKYLLPKDSCILVEQFEKIMGLNLTY